MNDEKSSFDYMWDLLNPPREFHNMRSKCETALWNTLSIHMQHRVYRLIRDRKRRGETVHPNPWYAIVNARDAEPTNYNGDARIDDLSNKERYYGFIEYLNKNGYAVVISDMRGHGEDAPLLGHIADNKGEDILIDDQNKIYGYIKENFKDLPVYLFGHSMGSIICRVLLQNYSQNYQKVILSGYVAPNPISPVAVLLGNIVKSGGREKKSKFLASLALGP